MKKLLSKSKALIAVVSVFAILAVSLFSVLSGVNFSAFAASGSVSEFTAEEREVSLLDPTKPNSKSNPYIIGNANQLYMLLRGLSTYNDVAIDTTGAYFKVADGIKAMYMNGGETVAKMSTVAEVKNYFEVTNTAAKKVFSDSSKPFKGNFDGNGVTIYGIRGDDNVAGLFPYVAGDVTIKNVTVANSYLNGKASAGGGLVGSALVGQAANSIVVDNCAVINNFISAGRSDAGAGALFGFLYNQHVSNGYPTVTASNCIVYGNEIISTHASQPGCYAIAGSLNGTGHKFTNCILLDAFPFNTGAWHMKQIERYENVFTDADLSTVDVKYPAGSIETITLDDISGKAGLEKLSAFDFSSVWFANEGIPKLRDFHDITGTPVNVDGHNNEKDVCCDVVSVYDGIAAHVYSGNECTICGYAYPCADGHNFTDVPAVETSTEAPGNIAHKYCDKCQKKYADDAAVDAPLSSALSEDEVLIPQILPYDTWDGTWDDFFWIEQYDSGITGTVDNPFIIETAEQLAAVVTARLKAATLEDITNRGFKPDMGTRPEEGRYSMSGSNYIVDTSGIYFKVKDGITGFRMNGGETVVNMTSAAEVKAYFESNTPGTTWWTSGLFKGNFNGNGATVYGLYATKEGAGLFPYLGADSVIKNITVKNSYIKGSIYSGGLFGQVQWYSALDTSAGMTTTVRNCAVINCYIRSENADYDAGAITSLMRQQKIKVKNFLAYGNDISSVSGNLPGIVGKSWYSGNEVSDCVLIGVAPFSIGAGRELNNLTKFSNVYTDQDLKPGEDKINEFLGTTDFKYAESAVKHLNTEQMMGIAAQENMPALDWVSMWKANDDSYPTPRLLTSKDYAAGYAWSGEIAQEFPAGEGTKSSPYKINAPEYLALMLNSKNDGLYYELIADININDTSADNWQENAKQWFTSENVETFNGTLNGNGYTIYGLYYTDVAANTSTGLIPVKGSGNVTNLTIANSYLAGNGAVIGAVVGSVEDGALKPVILQGNTVKDSVVIEDAATAGGLVGKSGNSVVRISNCISEVTINSEGTYGGLVGITTEGTSVKSSVSANIVPFGNADTVTATDVYTDATTSVNGVIVLSTDEMKGDAAKDNMTGLNFVDFWTTVANDYPALKGVIDASNGLVGEVWSGDVANEYQGGTGTKEDPYIIATGEQLARCATLNKAGTHYKLVADIYLNDINSPLWEDKIGCNEWYNSKTGSTWEALKNGSFDGDGYVIYGLYYNRAHYEDDSAFNGLFATIGEAALIENVGISHAYMAGSTYSGANFNEFMGAITGYISDWDGIDGDEDPTNGSYLPAHDSSVGKAITSDPEYQARQPVIRNCFVDHNSYLSGMCVGGFVGAAHGSFRMENCIFTGSLKGRDNATTAGLIGQDMGFGGYHIDCVSFPQTCDRPLGGAANADWRTTPQYFVTTAEDVYYFSMYRVYNTVTKISKPEQRIDEAAKAVMLGLDWVGNTEDGTDDLWRVVKDGTPMLTIFDKHRDDADKFSDRSFAAPEVTVNLVTGASDVQLDNTVLNGRMYSKMELPTPSRVGYKFTGWYPHSNLSVEYPYDYFPPRNLNLYAGWEPVGVICNFENYTDTIWDYDDTRWIFNKPGAKGGYKNAYVRNGSKSMHLLDTSSEAADVLLNYDPMLEIGETYEMTFWVTTDKADNPATKLSLVHNAKPVYLNTGIAMEDMVTVEKLTVGEWTQYKYVFTAQTKWISIRATGNSSLYFDDIIIAPTSAAVSNTNITYLSADAYVDNVGVSPQTSDNATIIVTLISTILACAVIVVISRKNLVEIIED